MSGPVSAPVQVTTAQQAVLTTLRRRASCPQALVLRAAIILGAAAGQRNDPLARHLASTPTTIRKWRGRWWDATPHLLAVDDDPGALAAAIATALADAPRSGTSATFTAAQIVGLTDATDTGTLGVSRGGVRCRVPIAPIPPSSAPRRCASREVVRRRSLRWRPTWGYHRRRCARMMPTWAGANPAT